MTGLGAGAGTGVAVIAYCRDDRASGKVLAIDILAEPERLHQIDLAVLGN